MNVTVRLTKREAQAFMRHAFDHPYGVRKSNDRCAAEVKIATAIRTAQVETAVWKASA